MAAELGARPTVTVGQELGEQQDYGPFLGVVICDDWEPPRAEDLENADPSKPARWRLHIAVRPVDFEIGGETHAFHKWISYSDKANSALGAFLEGLKEMFPTEHRVGEGDLVGTVAVWERRTITFGKAKDGTDMAAKDIPIPIRPATPEETAKGKAVLAGHSVAGKAVESAPASDIGEDELATVLALVDGKKKGELQTAVFADTSLSREVKQAVMKGDLLTALIEQGKLVQNKDGSYSVL